MFEFQSLPSRSPSGEVRHPDLPEVPDGSSFADELAKLGYESRYVDLSQDWACGRPYHLYQAGITDIANWQPTRPSGPGWTLAAIWDCEDGPTSLWTRPRRESLVSRIKAKLRLQSQVRAAGGGRYRIRPCKDHEDPRPSERAAARRMGL